MRRPARAGLLAGSSDLPTRTLAPSGAARSGEPGCARAVPGPPWSS